MTKAVPCTIANGHEGMCMTIATCMATGGAVSPDVSNNCQPVSTSLFITEANNTRVNVVVRSPDINQALKKELVHRLLENPVEYTTATQRYSAHVVICPRTVVSLLSYTVMQVELVLPMTDANTGFSV
jgi:hypothetical protein